MKKFISLFLSAVTAISALASCSVPADTNISQKITVSSSAAEGVAEWLTDRLGDALTDNVVMGVGDSYGVDMSEFEDDGYIIKNSGESMLLLGKTEEGLDLAARKYANSVTLGKDIGDTVYHEGYRIERFTLFGRDISEYTIVYPEEHNVNMSFAVSEFQRLIKQACGVELPVVVGYCDASPQIRFEYSNKEELKIGGYEYFERDGDLVFSSAVREGSTNAAYRFLEIECGWDWLIYGNSDLQETDHLVIEKGLYKTATPAFEWHIVSKNRCIERFENDRIVREPEYLNLTKEQQSYPIKHANHGMSKYNWANWVTNNHTGQICYTSEAFLEATISNVSKHLKSKEAEGEIIGETIRDVDIAQGDSGTYCSCSKCLRLVSEEKSVLGPVVIFANEVAETINAEYPGKNIIFKIFAYYGALDTPKKTKPNEWISVSYAPNGSCANHFMDGSQCDPNTNTFLEDSGVEFGQYLKNWCAVSDWTYVWYYHIGESFNYYNAWNLIYHDYKFMYEQGVRGVYFYNYARGMGLKTVERMLAWYLLWDIDMTWEEYEALFDRILEEEYGDGWQSLKELLRIYDEIENDKCWHCWGYSDRTTGIDMYDLGYIANNYKEMARLIENTVTLATNPYQETKAEMFSVSLYYTACYTNFFRYYNANNTDGLAELEAMYQTVIDRFAENGYTHTRIPNLSPFSIGDTIYEEAMAEWSEVRGRLPSDTTTPSENYEVYAMNKKIASMGEITDRDAALDAVKLYEDYNALSAEKQALVIDFDTVKSKLGDALAFFSDGENDFGLKVMSFNVYYSRLEEDRINRVAQIIKNELPDIIGVQEGMLPTCEAILNTLGDTYGMIGVGRYGTADSENCHVFYNKEKFDLLDYDTLWLSRTPGQSSKPEAAGHYRIMTYQQLQRKSDGQIFVHVNTHLDLNGSGIRKFEFNVIHEQIKKRIDGEYPTVITGDFNCTADSPEFAELVNLGYTPTSAYGENLTTFQGWGESASIIDFIVTNSRFPVQSYKVCSAIVDGEYASDHNPIVSELLLMPTYKYLKSLEK